MSASHSAPALSVRNVNFETQRGNEASAQHARRHACDAAFAHAEERERRLGQVDVGERLQQLAAPRPCQVERRAMTRGIDERAVHAPARIPQQQFAVDAGRAARGGREVVALLGEARDDAVVAHDAALIQQQSIARHADAQVGEAAGVDAIEKRAGVGAEDFDLPERGYVDEARSLAHRAHFIGDALRAWPVDLGKTPGVASRRPS